MVETNSPQVIAQITTDRIAVDGEVKDGFGVCKLKKGVQDAGTADALMKAMEKQIKYDKKQLSLCEVQAGEIDQAELDEAEEVEQQCHMNKAHQEETWDGVNNCRLNLEMVREARHVETQNESRHQSSDPEVQRLHRKTSDPSAMGRHEQTR